MLRIPTPSSGPLASPSAGMPLPPMDGMQDETRLRFLHGMVLQWGDPELGAALEIGVFMGCSTVVLADACRRRGFDRVTGIDLFSGTPGWGQVEDTYQTALDRTREFGFGGMVDLIRGDSRQFAWEGPIAVLHIDGDHSLEGVRSDIRRFAPSVAPGGIVVFDDYDGDHQDVQHAVHELLAAPAGFDVVGVNNSRPAYGSICLRRR